MSVINANPLMLGDAGYNIQRSLRFRSSASAYLNRTPASNGNSQTFTISLWVKRGSLSSSAAYNFFQTATVGGAATQYCFDSDNLRVYYYNGSSYVYHLISTQVFRDPSSWYHIVLAVDTTQATASNRVKFYVNGSQITSLSTATYPSQNATTDWNTAKQVNMGSAPAGSIYFDGYFAEVYNIDGQALTPSSFGQTDAVTGVWQPKKYTGTYGTNGFYLPFSDNTSATTLAYDKSGNNNNWTANNISTTVGATYDSMTDVPTLTSATAANYCVLNPLNKYSGITISNANLNVVSQSSNTNWQSVTGTIGSSTGKFYWEFTAGSSTGGNLYFCGFALPEFQATATNKYPGIDSVSWGYYGDNGSFYGSGSTGSGATYTNGDIIGVALDLDNGKAYFAKNGVWQNSGNPATQTAPAFTGLSGILNPALGFYNGSAGLINFGQRPFSYTPPTGFVALNTFNLPDPTIKKPNQYMTVDTFTGDATNNRVRSVGMKPDLVWVKNRSAVWDHILGDTVRLDASNQPILLSSSLTNAEFANGYISSTNNWPSDGYAVNSDSRVNGTGNGIVSWLWKKGATPGFDIVTYTGNGTAGNSINHSLGVAPSMIIVKSRNQGTYNWFVYHKNMSASYVGYLLLNSTQAYSSSNIFLNSAPSSTTFTLTSYAEVNGNGNTHVAYLFSEIPGFSKFGSYTGNGSADGPFVYCGFRPKYVMVKRSDSTGNWIALDTARDTYNKATYGLYANSSAAETSGWSVSIVSNGFKLDGITAADLNASGGTYIFAAFAESPQKFSLAR